LLSPSLTSAEPSTLEGIAIVLAIVEGRKGKNNTKQVDGDDDGPACSKLSRGDYRIVIAL